MYISLKMLHMQLGNIATGINTHSDLLIAITAIFALIVSIFSLRLSYKREKRDRERPQIIESTGYIVEMLKILEESSRRLESLINGDLNSLNFQIPEKLDSDTRHREILGNIVRRHRKLKHIIDEHYNAVKNLKKCEEKMSKSPTSEEVAKIVENGRNTKEKVDKIKNEFEIIEKKFRKDYNLTEGEIKEAIRRKFF